MAGPGPVDQAQDIASRPELEKPIPPVVQTQTDTGTPTDTDMNTDTDTWLVWKQAW